MNRRITIRRLSLRAGKARATSEAASGFCDDFLMVDLIATPLCHDCPYAGLGKNRKLGIVPYACDGLTTQQAGFVIASCC